MGFENFRKGGWFTSFVTWILSNYAKRVDAVYIRRKYPGVKLDQQAAKAITLAAKYSGVAGGMTAAAVSAVELSLVPTFGIDLPVIVPTIGVAVMADIGYTTLVQLRTTYDLSVIHGAPLAADDVEDCFLIFMLALGIKLEELAGNVFKVAGPRIVAYNARQILRSGVRAVLVGIAKKLGGAKLARKLTERALMRLIVPGVNIPIASGFNYYFTKQVLNIANQQMRRRGAVVQPLIRLYKEAPNLDRTVPIKAIITVLESGSEEGWSPYQLDAIRHCQGFLRLSDADVAKLESWFDRDVKSLISEMPSMNPKAGKALVDLLTVCAALFPDSLHDAAYSASIIQVATSLYVEVATKDTVKDIQRIRKQHL